MKIHIPNLERGKNVLSLAGILGKKFCGSDLKIEGPVAIEGTANLGPDFLLVMGSARASVIQVCSRCANEFVSVIGGDVNALFTWSKRKDSNGAGETWVQFIPPETKLVDLSEVVRECLILNLPMKPVCSEACKGLCQGCLKNLNNESCACGVVRGDERWHTLLKLKKTPAPQA